MHNWSPHTTTKVEMTNAMINISNNTNLFYNKLNLLVIVLNICTYKHGAKILIKLTIKTKFPTKPIAIDECRQVKFNL